MLTGCIEDHVGTKTEWNTEKSMEEYITGSELVEQISVLRALAFVILCRKCARWPVGTIVTLNMRVSLNIFTLLYM